MSTTISLGSETTRIDLVPEDFEEILAELLRTCYHLSLIRCHDNDARTILSRREETEVYLYRVERGYYVWRFKELDKEWAVGMMDPWATLESRLEAVRFMQRLPLDLQCEFLISMRAHHDENWKV